MDVKREKAEARSTKGPRKLNYNAPLLSTRRPSGATNLNLSRTGSLRTRRETSERVPFSWEQIPGKPKNMEKVDDKFVPPPKPPPGKWHPPPEQPPVDDGCEGDVDEDVFSDAIDLFSLSESVEMLRTFDKIEGFGSDGDCDQAEEEYCSAAHSPSFIIERFLTDASALAASSSCTRNVIKQQLPMSNNRGGSCVSEAVVVTADSSCSTQGCGLNSFLPWRMKHKPCGIRSPVRQAIISPKPQGIVRRKQNL